MIWNQTDEFKMILGEINLASHPEGDNWKCGQFCGLLESGNSAVCCLRVLELCWHKWLPPSKFKLMIIVSVFNEVRSYTENIKCCVSTSDFPESYRKCWNWTIYLPFSLTRIWAPESRDFLSFMTVGGASTPTGAIWSGHVEARGQLL